MGTLTANGYGLLSGNGRYVVSPLLGNQDAGDFVDDLQTGQGWTTEVPRSSGGRVISDNGVVVTLTLDVPEPLTLIAFSNGTKITAPATPAYTPTEGVIDAAGDIIVYAAKPPGSTSRVLRIFRPGQNQDTLFMQASSDSYAPAIDASGTRVTFISTAPLFAAAPAGVAQLYAINIDGTGLQQLSNANAAPGVVQYALSDDGHVTWYVLGDGALIKLNIDSGVRTFFHPSSVDVSNTVVPGSAVTFYGANLSGGTYSAAGSPLPRELGGVRVVLNGVPAPMISVTPTSLIFQAPWETPSGQPVDLQVITHAGSESETFAQTVITPVAIAPAPVSLPGTYGGTAIHQDGSGFVTDQNPANAGEVVYLYAMGLGPVAGPMITGLAPIAPANVVTQLSCSFPVLYTGLAPGLPGYYQINILIPPKIPFCAPCAEPTPILYLDCGTNMTALIPTTDPPGK
jgi:uncharacterized protein (TIGR03437 family)